MKHTPMLCLRDVASVRNGLRGSGRVLGNNPCCVWRSDAGNLATLGSGLVMACAGDSIAIARGTCRRTCGRRLTCADQEGSGCKIAIDGVGGLHLS